MTASAKGVHIAPTLDTMSALYGLSREGGPRSERFRAYVARVEREWGLVAYNPMAGDAAARAVALLRDMGAESIAREAAQGALRACEYEDEITLAVVVRSRGMWTDRVATELELRASPVEAYRDHGIVTLWSGDELDAELVRRESVAEAVRVMSTGLHGSARRVAEFAWREGLAYALAAELAHAVQPEAELPEAELPEAETEGVVEALEVLADSMSFSDVSAILFGDPACDTMGWPRLGIPANGGYTWAVRHARSRLAVLGPAAAIRQRAVAADWSAVSR